MKNFIALVVLSAHLSMAQWVQNDFVIGSFGDPIFVGNITTDQGRLTTFKNAHFNTLSGEGSFAAYDYNTTPTSLRYRLERVAAVGGLKMLVTDSRFNGKGTPYNSTDVASAIQDYKALETTNPNLWNAMLGYHVSDEPEPIHMPDEISKIQHLMADDPSKLSWANLLANRVKFGLTNFFGAAREPDYITYVSDYLSSGARVISFDNYCFTTNGAEVRIRDRFFRNNQIVAEQARSSGANFWGVPQSANFYTVKNGAIHQIHDGPVDFRALSQGRMRFMAHTPVIYGAKGILWFTYAPYCWQLDCATPPNDEPYDVYENKALVSYPNHTTNTSGTQPIYTWVQGINLALKNMGPTLMTLRWLGTVHGSATNNMATSNNTNFNGPPETGLPVVDATTELVQVNGISPNPENFAIGLFEGLSPYQYIIVLNKDVANQRTVTIALKPTVRGIARHNKTTNSWTQLSGTTSVTLTISAGDIQMVRLDKTKIRKYLKPAVR